MITPASFVVGLALFSLGLGLLALVERVAARAERRPRTRVERASLALLLGLGVGPALWTALVIAAGPPSTGLARVLVAVALAAGLPALPRLLRGDGAAPGAEAWRPVQVALAAGCLGFLGFAQFYAASMPMHLFDPLYHFSYKGKLVHHEGFGTPSWMVLPPELEAHRAVGRPITHPNYPPGLPSLHAIVAGAGGAYEEDATRSLMGLFVLASSGLLWVVLRPRGRTPALLGTLAWCALPLLFYSRLPHNYITWELDEPSFVESLSFAPLELLRAAIALWIGGTREPGSITYGARRPDGWTLDGAADLPLAAALLGAAVLLWRRSPGSGMRSDRADAWVGGLLLGSAVLIKNEGLALAALTLAVFGATALVRRAFRSSAPAAPAPPLSEFVHVLLLLALVAGPWLAIRGAIPSIDEDYPRALKGVLGLGEPPPGAGVTNNTPTDLAGALARVPVVLGGFATSFLHLLRWNLTWVGFAAVLAWWCVRRPPALARHPLLPLVLLVLGAIAAYAVILLLTPWDLASLYSTTIPGRLVLHVAPIAILCTFGLAWTTAAERAGRPGGRGASGPEAGLAGPASAGPGSTSAGLPGSGTSGSGTSGSGNSGSGTSGSGNSGSGTSGSGNAGPGGPRA